MTTHATSTRTAKIIPLPLAQRLPNLLGQAAMLQWLGQPPIAFQRAYVDIAGGVLPALWLSSAMNRVARASASDFESNGDYVFAMPVKLKQASAARSRSVAVGN